MVDEQDTMVRLPLLAGLSYREWHALVEGVYCGARWGSRQHDYSREDHYWRAGYLAGTAVRYALVSVVVVDHRRHAWSSLSRGSDLNS